MDFNKLQAHTSLADYLLKEACELIVADSHYQTSWGDGTDRSPDAWLQRFKRHEWVPVLWTYQGEPGGFHWLHDFAEDYAGAYTWVGGLVFPAFRGRKYQYLHAQSWQLMRMTFEEIGFARLFAACLAHNRAGQAWCEQTCHYIHAGIYRDWLLHNGALTDCVLYSIRPEDQSLLWVVAEQRAARVRRLKRDHDMLTGNRVTS